MKIKFYLYIRFYICTFLQYDNMCIFWHLFINFFQLIFWSWYVKRRDQSKSGLFRFRRRRDGHVDWVVLPPLPELSDQVITRHQRSGALWAVPLFDHREGVTFKISKPDFQLVRTTVGSHNLRRFAPVRIFFLRRRSQEYVFGSHRFA